MEANIADAPSRLVVGQDLFSFLGSGCQACFSGALLPVLWLLGEGGLAYSLPVSLLFFFRIDMSPEFIKYMRHVFLFFGVGRRMRPPLALLRVPIWNG